MSESQKSDTKNEIIEILDHLPPTKVVQLLEFARHLQSPSNRDRSAVMQAIERTMGKYKDVLSSSEEFAAQKEDERLLEDR